MAEMTKHMVAGAAAGAAGAALIRGMMAGSQKLAPETLPPMKQDPGEFMVEQAKKALPQRVQERIPAKAQKAVASSLGFGYGISFGLLYGLLAGKRRRSGTAAILKEGSALGIATWAVGYLGWLPATKLMPPVWKQRPKQVVPEILSHILFGVGAVAVFKALAKKL